MKGKEKKIELYWKVKWMYRNGGNIKIMLTQHINIVPFFPVSSLLFPQEEFRVEASLIL